MRNNIKSKKIIIWLLVLILVATIITATTVLLCYPSKYKSEIKKYSKQYELNPSMVASVIKIESNYNSTAISQAGAIGLMQIMPTTAVEVANKLGIETIITDHHEPANQLPNAVAVVDAKRKDSKYQCRNLAGVGVVFKLIQALGINMGLEEKEYLKYLDIVCVGTISDIVSLTDENRVIVKLGLKLVERTKNLGLRAILQASGYNKVDSVTISFGIAPRINACGRMGHQEEALNLFLSNDKVLL